MNALSTRLSEADVAEMPALWSGDVLVAGGGSAGCSAAVAAARAGAKTLVVEARGYLGGTGASVLDTFYGFFAPGRSEERVVGGVGWEVCERLLGEEQAFARPNTYGAGTGITYEPDRLRLVWDDLVEQAGASVLLHCLITAVVMNGLVIVGVVAATRSGPVLLRGGTVVDATGDADVSWRAGAAVELSLSGKRVQPLTTTFRIGFVEKPQGPPVDLRAAMRDASDSGQYSLPRVDGSVHKTVLPGVVHANLTRVSGVNATDPWELSRAERLGRQQVAEYVRFLTERVPGYEDAKLLAVMTPIGVRETRRLVGEYVLTRDDVLAAVDFSDSIARCGAPIEDHDAGGGTRWEYIGGNDHPSGATYGIPFRSLIPMEIEGLVVAGRCLSATHDAHASVRSMAQCMAMGHAAGLAAALSGDHGVSLRKLDAKELRAALCEGGALL